MACERHTEKLADTLTDAADISIEKAIELYGKGYYSEACSLVSMALGSSQNSYELYYIYAKCLQQSGDVEKAYFYYKMSIMLGSNAPDKEALIQGYNELCSYACVDDYAMGKACESLVTERLVIGEYNNTHRFLSEQLFTDNSSLGKMVLTENNMLLFIMLEISLCEMNLKDYIVNNNTCCIYHNNVGEFNEVYKQVKLSVRRVWLGMPIDQQKELNDILDSYRISADMLVVIAKYSVVPEFWQDVLLRLQAIVQYKHPDTALRLGQYVEWLRQQNIGAGELCRKPQAVKECEKNSQCNIPVIKLDYTQNYNKEDIDSKHRLAIIYCADNELYAKECVRYINMLEIPDNMEMEIIQVWNAPGMAAGYNAAMNFSSADIKLYIHQDTFLLDNEILNRVVETFSEDSTIGMVGIMGSVKLPESGFWWSAAKEDMRMFMYQDAVLNVLTSKSAAAHGNYEEAEALDGIFIATNRDYQWESEVFNHWHFYDISQCFEFRKHGLKTVCLNQLHKNSEMFALHETTMKKDSENNYKRFCGIFNDKYING